MFSILGHVESARVFPPFSRVFLPFSAQKNRHIFTQSRVRSAQKVRNPKLTTVVKKSRNLASGQLLYIYIYMYQERERERKRHIVNMLYNVYKKVSVIICNMYVYIYIYMHTHPQLYIHSHMHACKRTSGLEDLQTWLEIY